ESSSLRAIQQPLELFDFFEWDVGRFAIDQPLNIGRRARPIPRLEPDGRPHESLLAGLRPDCQDRIEIAKHTLGIAFCSSDPHEVMEHSDNYGLLRNGNEILVLKCSAGGCFNSFASLGETHFLARIVRVEKPSIAFGGQISHDKMTRKPNSHYV